HLLPRLPHSPLFPYTTLFRSNSTRRSIPGMVAQPLGAPPGERLEVGGVRPFEAPAGWPDLPRGVRARESRFVDGHLRHGHAGGPDRKSTRLNSSHVAISYAVF